MYHGTSDETVTVGKMEQSIKYMKGYLPKLSVEIEGYYGHEISADGEEKLMTWFGENMRK